MMLITDRYTSKPIAHLKCSTLRDADLTGMDLHNADLRGQDLNGAILVDTNLTGADLRDTDLQCVIWHRTNLTNADLRGARIFNDQGMVNMPEVITTGMKPQLLLVPK